MEFCFSLTPSITIGDKVALDKLSFEKTTVRQEIWSDYVNDIKSFNPTKFALLNAPLKTAYAVAKFIPNVLKTLLSYTVDILAVFTKDFDVYDQGDQNIREGSKWYRKMTFLHRIKLTPKQIIISAIGIYATSLFVTGAGKHLAEFITQHQSISSFIKDYRLGSFRYLLKSISYAPIASYLLKDASTPVEITTEKTKTNGFIGFA